MQSNVSTDVGALRELEQMHRVIVLYLWLNIRFPQTFTSLEKTLVLKSQCESLIDKALGGLQFKRSKKAKRKIQIEEDDDLDSTIQVDELDDFIISQRPVKPIPKVVESDEPVKY